MTAYVASTSGNVNVSTNWTPNGIPGTTDTVTIGAFTMTIPASYIWTPGAIARTGTSDSARSKIVIAATGKLMQYGDITSNAWNEIAIQGAGEWDLRGFKAYFTVQTGSNLNNKITHDGLGKAKIYSSTTLGRVAKDATTASYGCLQLNNFEISNVDFCFGSGYYAGHHYDLQNGVFLAAGFIETSLYANNASDYRIKNVDVIGCKNIQTNKMAFFKADKDVSGGTVTGIRDISNVTFRNEVPLALTSLPSGYTEITLSSPVSTSDRYLAFYFQELVTGDKMWINNTQIATSNTDSYLKATSAVSSVVYIVDTSRACVQQYTISFAAPTGDPTNFYIDIISYPKVTWQNFTFAPTKLFYDKVKHEGLLTQGGTIQNVFSANVNAFGSCNRPMRDNYMFPAKNNPHTMENACLDFQYNVLDIVQPLNSNDGGDHFIVTDAGTHTIQYNLIIDNYGGACVNALGVASRTGTYNFKHNTYVADARTAVYGGLARNEASGIFSVASSLNVLNNINYVRSNPTGATAFRAFNFETAGNDQVKTFDYNAYVSCGSPQSSILYGVMSATKSVGDNLYGMHDFYTENPAYLDDTRGLQKWAAQYGATTQEQSVDFLVNGVNGYDPVTKTQISGNVQAQGIISLLAYVRAGYAPSNLAFKDSGSDGITRGAIEYQAIDTTPDAFTFGTVSSANLMTITTGPTTATIAGVTAGINISAVASGGLEYRVSTDGGTTYGAWTTATTNVQLAYKIQARMTSSSSYSTLVTGTLTVGGVAGTLDVTTRASNTAPNAFNFGAVSNTEITTVTVGSSQATISGVDTGINISAVPSGGLSYRVSTDGGSTFGAWQTGTTNVQSGYVLEARVTSSASFATLVTGTLTVGGVPGTLQVTTRASDITPNTFTLSDVTGVSKNTFTYAPEIITVAGVDSGQNVPVSVTGTAQYQISTDDGTTYGALTTSTTNVQLGYKIKVGATSASAYSTGVTGALLLNTTVTDSFTVTTRAQVTTPNAANFGSVSNATLLTLTSSSVQATITGVDSDASISAIPDVGLEFRRSTDGGSTFGIWLATTLTGNQLNHIFEARFISSSSYSTSITKNLTVGGTQFGFTVITGVAPSSGSYFGVEVPRKVLAGRALTGKKL